LETIAVGGLSRDKRVGARRPERERHVGNRASNSKVDTPHQPNITMPSVLAASPKSSIHVLGGHTPQALRVTPMLQPVLEREPLCARSVALAQTPPSSHTFEMPRQADRIPGFYTWSVNDVERLHRIKTAVINMFDNRKGQPKHGRRRMSDVIELGVLFSSAEKENEFAFAQNTERPEHKEMLSFIAEQLALHRDEVAQMAGCAPVPANDHNMNIVIRRYRPGQSIGFHTDRVEKLDCMVWSLVVDCGDPEDGLHFETAPGERVAVKEHPGLVSVQTGAARSKFKHGVSSVKHERISITWRFFLPSYLKELAAASARGSLPHPERLRWFAREVKRFTELHQNDMSSCATTQSASSSPASSAPSSPTHGSQQAHHHQPWTSFPAREPSPPAGFSLGAPAPAPAPAAPADGSVKVGIISSSLGGEMQSKWSKVSRNLCEALGVALAERFGRQAAFVFCASQHNDHTAAVLRGIRRTSPLSGVAVVPEETKPFLLSQSPNDRSCFSNSADVYVLLEGGFDSAVLARQVEDHGKPLVRLGASGGAAADWFGLLRTSKPAAVPLCDWERLQRTELYHTDPSRVMPTIQGIVFLASLAVDAIAKDLKQQAGWSAATKSLGEPASPPRAPFSSALFLSESSAFPQDVHVPYLFS